MKPVALVERAIRNSSKPRDTVLDRANHSAKRPSHKTESDDAHTN
jgi:hypothetical protein